MTPTWYLAAGALVAGFGAGYALEHTIKSAEIAEIKLTDAQAVTAASQVALADYQLAAKTIKEAAGGAQVDISALNTKLDSLEKRIKNVKPPPLPDDCHPGPERVRNLAEAAAAVDQAIARPVTGK